MPPTMRNSGDESRGLDNQSLVDALCLPETYPERPRSVELVETHISWVFLTDRHAYKLKKPVRFDFLDFSTPALRRAACREEVTLNRRLAPDVYLGVVPITASPQGRLQIDGGGAAVDWMVRMRRLPKELALDALIRRDQLTDEQIHGVARTLAAFYGQTPPVSLRTDRYRQTVETHVQGNFTELLNPAHGFDAWSVKRIHAAQLRVLRLCPETFDNRVRDGRIVNAHGDLRPEHIYLSSPPSIIDCIEFNAEFRQLDVLDELCFLAVECAYLNADAVGGRILEHCLQASGDQPPPELLPFYMSYRAAVRAKVHALRALQLASNRRQPELEAARRYLTLADHCSSHLGPPVLAIVRGLSGAGKSTLARAVSESLGIELLQTDGVRQQLFGRSESPAGFDQGSYRAPRRIRVYNELFHRAEALLARGVSVVLDGTFLAARLRTRAALLARRHGAEPVLFECRCPDDLAQERIAERAADSQSPSEARPEFRRLQSEQEEPDPPGLAACRLDATVSLPEMLEAVCQRLRIALAPCRA